jgi:hypothetical protein
MDIFLNYVEAIIPEGLINKIADVQETAYLI